MVLTSPANFANAESRIRHSPRSCCKTTDSESVTHIHSGALFDLLQRRYHCLVLGDVVAETVDTLNVSIYPSIAQPTEARAFAIHSLTSTVSVKMRIALLIVWTSNWTNHVVRTRSGGGVSGSIFS